jgi:hypothetical protein
VEGVEGGDPSQHQFNHWRVKILSVQKSSRGKDKQLKLGNAEAVGTQKTVQWRELLRSVCSATDNDAQCEHFPASSNTCFGEISESIMAAFAKKQGILIGLTKRARIIDEWA